MYAHETMADYQQNAGAEKLEKGKEAQNIGETLSVKESMLRKKIKRRQRCSRLMKSRL